MEISKTERIDYKKVKLRKSARILALPPRYPAYFIIGRKGAGKSALAERMAELYWWMDYVILDWNGAFDMESLHWCIEGEPWRDHKGKTRQGRAYPILLITPRNVAVTTNSRKIKRRDTGELVDAVKTIPDTEPLQEILQVAYRERRVVVFSIYLYKDPASGQAKLASLIKALPVVMRDKVSEDIRCVMLLRELADIASNKMKTHAGYGERETKRGLSWFIRQARHARTTIIADMQNPDDIYGSIEAQEDFILIKRLNRHHVPKKLQWLVDQIQRKREWAASHYILSRFNFVSVDHLSSNSFYCVWPTGEYTLEFNSTPRFRHHQPTDNAMKLAGIEVTPIEVGQDRTAEERVAEIREKKKESDARLGRLNRAFALYLANKKANPNYSWEDCAADAEVRFLGSDGKVAGNSLRMAVDRAGRRGLIDGYREWKSKDSANTPLE